MKIVFCIDSLNKGGAERVIATLSNELCKNHNITIITTASTKSEYWLNEDINVISLDNGNNQKLKNIKRIIALYKYIKEIGPEIVITFMPPQSFRALLLKKLLKTKLIVSVRNDPKKEFARLKYKIAMKLLYHKADGFVFQTEDAKSYFNKTIQNKSVIIPNPVNSKFIRSRYEGNREKEIVVVGRLEKQKNIIFLLKVYKKLLKHTTEYKLLIYGEGKQRKEIEEYIQKESLQNYVELKGVVNDIEERIYKSSLFVLPSLFEGMPNALMEAMALGLPCISTDCPCGGPRYLIGENNNGILVPINDEEQMLNAIIRVINAPKCSNEYGKKANNHMKQYKTEIISNKWEEYIKMISNKK